ncbi:E3 ubiquitin-protein ligase Topors [Pieris rapae]|uniref:E3 ubiquitin-protein ligase Topors n=1 Tax=Pieris rapae TaxID=64459 RepID=UPI001E27E963|nr:E3 ubiquitin-protein ligase Topors [Pieris rapae]
METISNTSQGDSSVKSDDSSPQHESGRSSPPPNCAICLGTCKNKSFTDSCLHQFCFRCILKWSKVKAECPLCKQIFKSIIHNVRSNHQYEEYMVEQRNQVEDIERIELDNLTNATQRFRYRTTLTLPYRDSWAIEQILSNYRTAARRPPPAHRRRPPSFFRRTVYRHNLWARPLPDFTGRYRDCAPDFYRCNDSQMHRLVPWLSRELHYLLNENVGHISYVMTQIMDLLPRYHINSTEFREAMQRYFGDRTEHFLHELYCFASTPYDMAGYDRNVQYTTDSRVSTIVNEVISSSDNDSSLDSEVNMDDYLRHFPLDAPPGPSRGPAPVYPQPNISNPSTNDVIPIETISHSDSDDNSEVMVVGYIKPPHARTPEVVDLLESDSDVVIEEDAQPPRPIVPPQASQTQEIRPVPLVKLTLKQHHPPSTTAPSLCPSAQRARAPSDSDDSTYTPPLSQYGTYPSHSSDSRSPVSATSTSSESDLISSSSSSSTDIVSYYSDSSSDSYKPRPQKIRKKKTKRKSSKSDRTKKKIKRPKKEKKSKTKTVETKQSNRKSYSGKGVKSSKSAGTAASTSSGKSQTSTDQPSTSGTQNSRKRNARKAEDRISCESKRLKSAVSVVSNQRHLRSSTCSEASSHANSSKSYADGNPSQCKEKGTDRGPNTIVNKNSDVSDTELNVPRNITDSF